MKVIDPFKFVGAMFYCLSIVDDGLINKESISHPIFPSTMKYWRTKLPKSYICSQGLFCLARKWQRLSRAASSMWRCTMRLKRWKSKCWHNRQSCSRWLWGRIIRWVAYCNRLLAIGNSPKWSYGQSIFQVAISLSSLGLNVNITIRVPRYGFLGLNASQV